MLTLDIYTSVGVATKLLSNSKYHSEFDLADYIGYQVLPPIINGQYKIYYSSEGKPIAFISWARISPDVWDEISSSGQGLRWEDWNSGDLLYFNDFIAPYGNARSLFKDLADNVFPGENKALSLRRIKQGMIRKQNNWVRRDINNLTQVGEGV